MFTTKIAVIVRDDLALWQKLNVTAFLTSGIVGASPEIIGEPYEDGSGEIYNRLSVQPIVVLVADSALLTQILRRGREQGVRFSLYTQEMFATGHDAANRAAVKAVPTAELNIVGLALREDKKLVDKITKGAKLHP